jgi:hypothetical protein
MTFAAMGRQRVATNYAGLNASCIEWHVGQSRAAVAVSGDRDSFCIVVRHGSAPDRPWNARRCGPADAV